MAWCPFLPPPGWLWGLAGLGVTALIHHRSRLACFCFGLCWCAVSAQQAIDARWPHERAGEVQVIEGTVVGLPEWSGQSLRFRLKTDDPNAPKLIEARWYRAREHIQPGDIWRLPLALYPPNGRLNFSGFDYERYLLTEGIHATARVRSGASHPQPQYLGTQDHGMAAVHRLRQRLAEHIQATTTDLDVAALKRALLLGDRSAISDQVRQLLQDTGTSHLLAISGLHVGMMAGLGAVVGVVIWGGCVLLGIPITRTRTALGVGWLFALGYAALAGFSLPTQRALIMLTVAMLATLARRRTSPVDGLLLALLVVLLIDPLGVLSAGLWLSFGAVAFLIWGFGWRTQTSKHPAVGRGLMRAQWLVMVGLLPLSVGIFGHWVPGAFAANVGAIPWVSVVVLPATLLSTGLSVAGVPWVDFAHWADQSLAVVLMALAALNDTGLSAVPMPSVTVSMMAVGLVGAAWLLAPAGWAARSVGGALLVGAVLVPKDTAPDNVVSVTVFDVGSGLAAVVESGSYRLLFDTGPGDGEGQDTLGGLLARQDKRMGDPPSRQVFNDVVLSWDHRGYRGGLSSLLDRAWVGRVYQSFDAVDEAVPSVAAVQRCQRGTTWSHADLHFEFVHPGPYLPDLGGNSSCVLSIRHSQGSVLLVSGLDAVGEAHVLQMQKGIGADTVVVARSGHADATSDAWLDALNPERAVISVGLNDRHQRPDPAVVERLVGRGVDLYQTSHCGAVAISWTSGDDQPHIETAVGQRRRFWHGARNC